MLLTTWNYTRAIENYDKALAIDPNYKYALHDKGLTLSNLGNYVLAIQSFDKALTIAPNDSGALKGKQNAISKLVASAPTSGYSCGCSDAQISNSDRYINQPQKGPSYHSKAYEGFNSCSGNSNIFIKHNNYN